MPTEIYRYIYMQYNENPKIMKSLKEESFDPVITSPCI